MPARFSVRRTVEADWRQVRALRLEALGDTPIAFLETLAAARAADEAEWRRRAARGSSDASITVAAVEADGRFVGTMGGYLPDLGAGPVLVSVYVTPPRRGRAAGVTDALLAAVEAWAASRGGTLTLEVNERNGPARAAYASRGFVLTGRSRPYPLDPRTLELEMAKALGTGG